jgi:hypothetical protein
MPNNSLEAIPTTVEILPIEQLLQQLDLFLVFEKGSHGWKTIRIKSLIVLYFQIVILQPLKVLSKKKNEGRQWMMKLMPLKEMTLEN